jgi:hypothetical protein
MTRFLHDQRYGTPQGSGQRLGNQVRFQKGDSPQSAQKRRFTTEHTEKDREGEKRNQKRKMTGYNKSFKIESLNLYFFHPLFIKI